MVSPDISELDAEKLADVFKIVTDKVSVDREVIEARNIMHVYNEYVFGERNAPHHIEFCDALDTFEDVANITPRNSAKSTIGSSRYPAYRIGQDRGMRVILTSHTATLASSFSRSIENIMRLDKFILLFGDMIPSLNTSKNSDTIKWNETEKIVKDRPEFNRFGLRVDAKDATIFAVGVGGAVVGRRADIIVLDDIIDRNDVKTDQQILDIKYWYGEELKGTRHARTQTIVVGSRWSDRDIYIDIISRMVEAGAEITGNMVQEVLDQIKVFKELERELNQG